MNCKKRSGGFYVAFSMTIIMLVFLIDTGLRSYAQSQHKKEIKADTNFHRPEPSRPIQPEIPAANRYQDDKVFLEYADSLYKVKNFYDTVEKQILKGNVKFRQAGLWMYCDSAYYYPEQNSLDAFSNVKMEQGDTLFVYADKLFYNGDQHLAKLKNGPTRNKVTLINKDVTLTTDSLDYDMQIDLGWYTKWGTIDDKVNTLTSLYGEYSPKTKLAEFFHDVVLINNRDGYKMLTDTLYYSTATHIANIKSRTEIQSENDTIITTLATYYTDTGDADLLSRSLIIHRDSTGNVTTLEGDSIVYDNTTRISKAYMFRSPDKRPTPMVINDTAQKTKLIGGFGIYNDSTKEALATIYPLLIEYSTSDTLFLRADTIKTFLVTEMIPVKKRKTKSGFPEHNGQPIVKADSTGIWLDTAFFGVKIPYIDKPLEMLKAVAPPNQNEENSQTKEEDNQESKDVNINNKDSVNLSEEELKEITSGKDNIEVLQELGTLEAQQTLDNLHDIEASDSTDVVKSMEVNRPTIGLASLSNVSFDEGMVKKDTVCSNEEIQDSVPYESHVILAYHRGRFFKQDMQGVADSMVFVEKDSMLYLFRKPIIWNEERQVTGNRIDVHFNDSTTDWAYLPEYGLMSEHVDEDFYNQIYGKEITAYFENQGLKRLSVSGNVETIFLPQEQDSTYNRLVNAESSYMEVYMDSTQLDWLKMWPEVSGTVTPLFIIKRNQMYLQKFKWWNFLRPERAWYGDQMRWADNLGEVPDELEQYFLAPSDFGEPKTFSGTRVTPPPSTLPIWEDFPQVNLSDTILNVDLPQPPESLNQSIPNDADAISDGNSIDSPDVDSVTLEGIESEDKQEDQEEIETEIQTKEIEETVEKEEADENKEDSNARMTATDNFNKEDSDE